MKTFMRLTVVLLAGMLAAGCVFHKPRTGPAPAARAAQTVVRPDNSLTARVAACNAAGRFVVLSFPVGRMPGLEQTFFLYRNGLKVAEVRVSGPQRDNNIVADLVSGDAQVGDEVRSE